MSDELSSFDTAQPWSGPPWFDQTARWIKAHARLLLFAGVTIQLLVFISMIAIYSAPLLVGDRVLLRVRPVDPRDLFRGDYVVLSYDFSRIPPRGIPGIPQHSFWRRGSWSDGAWLADRTVYVSLEPEADGKHYRAAGISLERPSGRYLKGKYSPSRGGNLKFGIEAYYVQEGEGRVLEKLRNANRLSAEIALAPWGQATLCALRY